MRAAHAVRGVGGLLIGLALLLTGCLHAPASPNAHLLSTPIRHPTDSDISDAYLYLLVRALVLRQQATDLGAGASWNQWLHRPLARMDDTLPDQSVVYSDAWVVASPTACVLLTIPPIHDRYYTVQLIDGWGETFANLNERTLPHHPYGRFALCVPAYQAPLPPDVWRVNLPQTPVHAIARIALEGRPQEALALQQRLGLAPMGAITPPAVPEVPAFTRAQLPRSELFDQASAWLALPDRAPGATERQRLVATVVAQVNSGKQGRAHVDADITQSAWAELRACVVQPGQPQNGWSTPVASGSYDDNLFMRTCVNFINLWANTPQEVRYFSQVVPYPNATYTQTFAKDRLPLARYTWSVSAALAQNGHLLANDERCYALSAESPLVYNPDGSLTLVFGPTRPAHLPEANWLPTPRRSKGRDAPPYVLVWRLYGPESQSQTTLPPLRERLNP